MVGLDQAESMGSNRASLVWLVCPGGSRNQVAEEITFSSSLSTSRVGVSVQQQQQKRQDLSLNAHTPDLKETTNTRPKTKLMVNPNKKTATEVQPGRKPNLKTTKSKKSQSQRQDPSSTTTQPKITRWISQLGPPRTSPWPRPSLLRRRISPRAHPHPDLNLMGLMHMQLLT